MRAVASIWLWSAAAAVLLQLVGACGPLLLNSSVSDLQGGLLWSVSVPSERLDSSCRCPQLQLLVALHTVYGYPCRTCDNDVCGWYFVGQESAVVDGRGSFRTEVAGCFQVRRTSCSCPSGRHQLSTPGSCNGGHLLASWWLPGVDIWTWSPLVSAVQLPGSPPTLLVVVRPERQHYFLQLLVRLFRCGDGPGSSRSRCLLQQHHVASSVVQARPEYNVTFGSDDTPLTDGLYEVQLMPESWLCHGANEGCRRLVWHVNITDPQLSTVLSPAAVASGQGRAVLGGAASSRRTAVLIGLSLSVVGLLLVALVASALLLVLWRRRQHRRLYGPDGDADVSRCGQWRCKLLMPLSLRPTAGAAVDGEGEDLAPDKMVGGGGSITVLLVHPGPGPALPQLRQQLQLSGGGRRQVRLLDLQAPEVRRQLLTIPIAELLAQTASDDVVGGIKVVVMVDAVEDISCEDVQVKPDIAALKGDGSSVGLQLYWNLLRWLAASSLGHDYGRLFVMVKQSATSLLSFPCQARGDPLVEQLVPACRFHWPEDLPRLLQQLYDSVSET